MAVKGNATTHNDPGRRGSHKPQRVRPFAHPIRGRVRGEPIKGNTAPWYLTRRHLGPKSKPVTQAA